MTYAFDPSGTSPDNLVPEEVHNLPEVYAFEERFIVPNFAPFYGKSMVVVDQSTGLTLTRGVDYEFGHYFYDGSLKVADRIYGSVVFRDKQKQGQIKFMPYQCMGGPWVTNPNQVLELYARRIFFKPSRSWEEVTEPPERVPLLPHSTDIGDLMQLPEMMSVLEELVLALRARNTDALAAHIADRNGHGVTAQTLGLEQLPNFPPATPQSAVDRDNNTSLMTPFTTDLLLRTMLSDYVNLTYVGDPVDERPVSLVLGKRYLVASDRGLTLPAPSADAVSDTIVIYRLGSVKPIITSALPVIYGDLTDTVLRYDDDIPLVLYYSADTKTWSF